MRACASNVLNSPLAMSAFRSDAPPTNWSFTNTMGRVGHQDWATASATGWNEVHEKVGSFADEHSTL